MASAVASSKTATPKEENGSKQKADERLSALKYLGSFLVVAVSMMIGSLHVLGRAPKGVSIRLDKLDTLLQPDIVLTDDQLQRYQRDGSILIQNVMSLENVDRVKQAVARAPHPFSMKSSNYDRIRFDVWRISETVANLALNDLPKVAAQLMDDEPKSFRLLRDAYFSYAQGKIGCGWHVDDASFWPTRNDTAGLTIWLALDDMSSSGGGLVVANQTQLGADVVAKCRSAISNNTCAMEEQSPECHQLLENAIIQWDNVKAGDAIVWNRWTFHRTVPVKLGENEKPFLKRRYSVRYIPSNARAQGLLHSSVEQGETFEGSPYYPQVWPKRIESESKALEHGLDPDVKPYDLVMYLAKSYLKKYFKF